jgi:hypothetical protein
MFVKDILAQYFMRNKIIQLKLDINVFLKEREKWLEDVATFELD